MATIYFAGGEDIDGLPTRYAVTYAQFNYRHAFARGSFNINGDGAELDPPTYSAALPATSDLTSLWFHAQWASAWGSGAPTTTTTLNSQMLRIFSSDGVARLVVRGTGTDGQMKISKRNAAGDFTDLVTCPAGAFPLPALTAFDLELNYGTSGSITLYANGLSFCAYAGDVTTDGVTTVNQIELAGGPYGVFNNGQWSEIIESDSDTRAMAVQSLTPTIAGTTQQWSGATAAALKNGSLGAVDDTTYNATTTDNQISDWTIPALASGNWNVLAVRQVARMSIGGTGPQHAAFSARPAGQADQLSGSVAPSPGGFGNFSAYWAVNPATSAPWVPADLTGANFGVKSLS